MSPQHLAARRALYAAIDSAADRHLRPRLVDPRVLHSTRGTTCMTDDWLFFRDHRSGGAPGWRITTVVVPDKPPRQAVIDDFGTLVEVAR